MLFRRPTMNEFFKRKTDPSLMPQQALVLLDESLRGDLLSMRTRGSAGLGRNNSYALQKSKAAAPPALQRRGVALDPRRR